MTNAPAGTNLRFMAHEATKTFRFSIAGAELWVGLFMDDIEAPDLTLEAPASLNAAFETTWRKNEV